MCCLAKNSAGAQATVNAFPAFLLTSGRFNAPHLCPHTPVYCPAALCTVAAPGISVDAHRHLRKGLKLKNFGPLRRERTQC